MGYAVNDLLHSALTPYAITFALGFVFGLFVHSFDLGSSYRKTKPPRPKRNYRRRG